VLAADRAVLHAVGGDDVVAAGLVQREALGVHAVEGPDAQVGGALADPRLVQQGGELDAGPGDVGHPPAGDALEVELQVGLGPVEQVLVAEAERALDHAVDGQAVVGGAAAGQRAGHGVDAEPPGGRDERGEAGGVTLGERAQRALQAGLDGVAEDDAGGPEPEHPEHDAPADRLAGLLVRSLRRHVARLRPPGPGSSRWGREFRAA
jgi:hypothetical protein